jgi:hypothetical protein
MKELTLEQAIAARDSAMAAVEAKAEATQPAFVDMAAAFIVAYLRVNGAASSETITYACKESGLIPHDDRAFGPVYMRLSRQKVIAKQGHCVRRRGHGTSGGNIWGLGEHSGKMAQT